MDTTVPASAKTRRPRLPLTLPRQEITQRLPPEELVCSNCHQPMHAMGEDMHEELEFIPAHILVTRHIREEYACRDCEPYGTTGSMKVAASSPALIPKSYATPSLVAQIIIPLSRQTESQWLLKVAARLKPLRALMHDALKELGIASCQLLAHKYKRGGNEHVEIPNHLNRQFAVTAPNQVWCGDVTYIRTGKCWAYLAVVLELFAGKPVGWAMSTSPGSALTVKALQMGLGTGRAANKSHVPQRPWAATIAAVNTIGPGSGGVWQAGGTAGPSRQR